MLGHPGWVSDPAADSQLETGAWISLLTVLPGATVLDGNERVAKRREIRLSRPLGCRRDTISQRNGLHGRGPKAQPRIWPTK